MSYLLSRSFHDPSFFFKKACHTLNKHVDSLLSEPVMPLHFLLKALSHLNKQVASLLSGFCHAPSFFLTNALSQWEQAIGFAI